LLPPLWGEGISVLVTFLLIWSITHHAGQTRELMMPPADRIREQNGQDPDRVTHTRQEAGSNDFLAVSPALRVLQLNVEGLGS